MSVQRAGSGNGWRAAQCAEHAVEELALVPEVGVDGVALHAGLLGDRRDRRVRGTDARMQADRRLDDPLAGLGEPLSASFQLVLASHCTLVYRESLTAAQG